MARGVPRLQTTARKGDRRKTLEHVRHILASAIDAGPHPRDLASLTRRLQVVMAELDTLGAVPAKAAKERSAVDDIAERRAARRRAAGSVHP